MCIKDLINILETYNIDKVIFNDGICYIDEDYFILNLEDVIIIDKL